MTGRGAAGGFDFQSRVIAYVAARVIAKRRLDWTSSAEGDTPIAIRAEGAAVSAWWAERRTLIHRP